MSMRNLGSSILVLFITITAFPVLAQVESDSKAKQEVVGIVIWMKGDKPVGFASDLTIRLKKGSENLNVKTDQGGIFTIQLDPGKYRIKEICWDSKRIRLYRHQSKTLTIEKTPSFLQADIYVIKP
jgi:hypothetical protein